MGGDIYGRKRNKRQVINFSKEEITEYEIYRK